MSIRNIAKFSLKWHLLYRDLTERNTAANMTIMLVPKKTYKAREITQW